MEAECQAIEVFHLLFLRHLGTRVDKALYVLKGGCNLRFFFKSIRYSEDMDLDVHTIAPSTLTGNVNRILESPAFERALQAHRLSITHLSSPKQTATTQRWKIRLRQGPDGRNIPTKLEFSRRGPAKESVYEPVASEIIRAYRLYPVMTRHYGMEEAFRQKISALAQRGETEARDVFDLKCLLDHGAGRAALPAGLRRELPTAIENAMGLDYDAFAGQVLAYLAAEYQDYYGARRVWETLQEEVVEALEKR